MKGIILHGGHGTRLRPLTHTGPKQLLPIANKPMSQFCLESMIEAGVRDFVIIIGGIGSNKVREYYGNGEQFGIKITYVEQDYPRGIAHAISLCKDFVGNDRFLVFLGDNIIQKPISDFAKKFENSDASASILLCEVDNPSRFGIAEIKDGQILRIMEKPKDPPSNLAVTGIYFLTSKIFDIIQRLKPSWRNELEITDALHMLLKENNKITYDMITDYWKDTGTPEDIIHANGAILENMTPYFFGEKESQVTIEGNVMIGKGTIVKSGTSITGPAIIGKDCKIGPNVSIGPNTSIGDNSEISRCNIENSIIMSGCKINGDFSIRDSIIAFNAEITKSNTPNKVFLLGEGTRISL
ncbi:MAG: glucose-1-phosphate thymidylyltransferase [Nitrososphaeria archaeon]|nr:glucose-1-phosphate thymidylyltransferase [Nitrososphaerota archaeon]NDB92832.1 glucose-1-phosphate thymidylyltransferase [Nitrososphaeria archaeon]NDF25298.1 glucose-1-phosphate thymidylyltransferase [Nitrososphaerota archaeon]NDF30255.1 glucose-1-phosphate thymidylyltransferase [Nitrososphaeria archaeon]NDF35383.1 glucose-1-phosphate thymidylyltransferase [Nitrosopumilaceae archaeon]